MKKEREYYGIYFNRDDIPKLDKVNKYSKDVEIKFEGRTFLIKRDDDEKIVERIELENNYKFKKEGDYELEFIDNLCRTYHIDLKIRISYLFILLLLFILGFFIGIMLCNLKSDDKPLSHLYDFIDLAVIEVDIDKEKELDKDNKIITQIINRFIPSKKEKEVQKEYDFDVDFEHISSTDINLTDTVSAEAVAKNKIAPGVSGSFSIIMNTKKSSVDMNYYIKFKDIVKDKPANMSFKIRGTNKSYSSLQDLEKELTGIIEKKSTEEIIIDWEWKYESGDNEEIVTENDLVDTNDGKNLESYKFQIIVGGEEAL